MERVITKTIEVLMYGGIVQGIFFFIIIHKNKKWERRSNKILAILLLILSVSIAHSAIIDIDLGGPFKIKEPFVLLIGPLLFFYTREIMNRAKFTIKDLLHMVPFIVFGILILLLTLNESIRKRILINEVDVLSIGIWILTIVQYGFYWWKIIGRINISLANLKEEYSNLDGKSLFWLKRFLNIFGIFLLIMTLTIPLVIRTKNYSLIDFIVCFSIVVTVYILSYQGLFQEEIFSNIIIEEEKAAKEEEIKWQVNESEFSNYGEKEWQNLLRYMEEKKPYLEERLTLSGLAQSIGMTRNNLSGLINSKAGENFYQFINKYRIDEVKKIFKDPVKKNYTILAMAYEAGFASKSSFHNIFKKFTGLTPTEYLNRN